MMNSFISLLAALALSQPCGDAKVVPVRYIQGAEGEYGDGTIYISSYHEDLEYVYHHECAHHIHSSHRLPTVFGKPPYYTEYSRVDKYEDFAEVYAIWKTSPRLAWKLARQDYRARKKLRYIIKESKLLNL
eukprot:GHVR01027954.1.p1 GENE.GHVR01027954.1~~GHVR01027954.1.p1  ORF type:complete len:131 (+),score=9.51 GHVR01027954.1:410-802(+)